MATQPYPLRWILAVSLLTAVSCLLAVVTVESSNRSGRETYTVKIKGFTLNYYRAPEHTYPPANQLDPYDSFQKDASGDLQMNASGSNVFSEYCGADYHCYSLRTKKGNPVEIYQAVPARRSTYKTNCHGLTFLNGDYWMRHKGVEQILNDDGWSLVAQEEAQRGDVAIYREWGTIVHSARVVGRDEHGHVLVNSKDGYDNELKSVWALSVCPSSESK